MYVTNCFRYSTLQASEREQWSKRVGDLFKCKGPACRMQHEPTVQ